MQPQDRPAPLPSGLEGPAVPRTGAYAVVGASPSGWLTAGQAALVSFAPHLPAPHPLGRHRLWCVLSWSSHCGPDLWTAPSQEIAMGQPLGSEQPPCSVSLENRQYGPPGVMLGAGPPCVCILAPLKENRS